MRVGDQAIGVAVKKSATARLQSAFPRAILVCPVCQGERVNCVYRQTSSTAPYVPVSFRKMKEAAVTTCCLTPSQVRTELYGETGCWRWNAGTEIWCHFPANRKVLQAGLRTLLFDTGHLSRSCGRHRRRRWSSQALFTAGHGVPCS
jgi:hypothetical protein